MKFTYLPSVILLAMGTLTALSGCKVALRRPTDSSALNENAHGQRVRNFPEASRYTGVSYSYNPNDTLQSTSAASGGLSVQITFEFQGILKFKSDTETRERLNAPSGWSWVKWLLASNPPIFHWPWAPTANDPANRGEPKSIFQVDDGPSHIFFRLYWALTSDELNGYNGKPETMFKQYRDVPEGSYETKGVKTSMKFLEDRSLQIMSLEQEDQDRSFDLRVEFVVFDNGFASNTIKKISGTIGSKKVEIDRIKKIGLNVER
jgi:hypothetical protein